MTPEEIETVLTGQHVKLHPYTRGLFPPETLFTLWKFMQQEQATQRVFFGRVTTPTPYDTHGDLVDFVKHFDPDPPAFRVLLIAESQKSPGQVAGMFWFDDILPGVRATGSVFYRRKFWGEPAREASRLALRYGFEVLDVPAIFAFTPWEIAVKHAAAAGMHWVATIPRYVVARGHILDFHVMRIERGEHG